jgi:Family of unknown function (DUF5343)
LGADKAQSAFSKHDDAEFQKAFEALIKSAYKELFELHGDAAWQLDDDKLIGFFREGQIKRNCEKAAGEHLSNAGKPCWARRSCRTEDFKTESAKESEIDEQKGYSK